jgi:hypothetical protein
MYKKLFFVLMLLCGDCVLLGMNEKKDMLSLLGATEINCLIHIAKYLPLSNIGQLMLINKAYNAGINNHVDSIITDTTSAAHTELKQRYNMRTAALSHYATQAYGDWSKEKKKIFYQLLEYDKEQRLKEIPEECHYDVLAYYAGKPISEYYQQKMACQAFMTCKDTYVARNILKSNSFHLLQRDDFCFRTIINNVFVRELIIDFLSKISHSGGSDPGLYSRYHSVLYHACSYEGYDEKFITFLLKNNVSPDYETFEEVCHQENWVLFELLMPYGSVQICRLASRVFDQCYVSEKYTRLFKRLLSYADDTCGKWLDESKRTLLIILCRKAYQFVDIDTDFEEVVATLLDKGTNINYVDCCKQTALDYAYENKNVPLQNLLLKHGAKSGNEIIYKDNYVTYCYVQYGEHIPKVALGAGLVSLIYYWYSHK